MTRYIDAERLKEFLSNKYKEFTEKSKNNCFMQYQFMADGLNIAEQIVDSLQQEQSDFPTSDEQMKEFLATHPKIKVPEKYKSPDWLFKKQKQPEVDLEEEIREYIQKLGFGYGGWVDGLSDEDLKHIARHFYELGKNSK